MQAEAAAQFLTVMRRYLESLFSDLRSHTITSVQSNNDRVGQTKSQFVGKFSLSETADGSDCLQN